MSEPIFTRLKAALVAAVQADTELAPYEGWLRERLQNTPTLEERLALLAGRLSAAGHDLFVHDHHADDLKTHLAAWTWATRKGRNDIAHNGYTDALDSECMFVATAATAAVVELVLLAELGLDNDHLKQVIDHRHEYIARGIRQHLAPGYLAAHPHVPQPDTEREPVAVAR
jgi:hypothetical protein